MAYIATTDINHGSAGGEIYYVEEGDEVDPSQFTEEEFASLKASGAVEESAHLDKVEELRAEIARLEAELAAKQNEAAGKDVLLTGARNVDQTALDPQAGVPAGETPPQPGDDKVAAQEESKTTTATKPASTTTKTTPSK